MLVARWRTPALALAVVAAFAVIVGTFGLSDGWHAHLRDGLDLFHSHNHLWGHQHEEPAEAAAVRPDAEDGDPAGSDSDSRDPAPKDPAPDESGAVYVGLGAGALGIGGSSAELSPPLHADADLSLPKPAPRPQRRFAPRFARGPPARPSRAQS